MNRHFRYDLNWESWATPIYWSIVIFKPKTIDGNLKDCIAHENTLHTIIKYQGHLESSGNSEISQGQKQDPVNFSYQCKGLYLFFQMTILSTYSSRLYRVIAPY